MRKNKNKLLSIVVGLGVACSLTSHAATEKINLRAIGVVSTHHHHNELEEEFYRTLAEKTGLDISINFNPLDVVGVDMKDTLRLVRSGTFDVVEATIGSPARDDPFLEGFDLIGVSPDLMTLRDTVDAYREVMSTRVEDRFNAKVMALWPFGPQVFFCSGNITKLQDLEGHKVRSYTSSMSALLEYLGATPVTLQFAEVYPALQRGVADCAITSPTSGNTGNWPEVTDKLISLGISWSVQGHFMNLDSWNKLSGEAQGKLEKAYAELESTYWEMANKLTEDATNCNVGRDPCEGYNEYNMEEIIPSEEDNILLREAVENVILPEWGERCDKIYADCSKVWNETIGKARGYMIK